MIAPTVKHVDFANCAGWKMGRKAREYFRGQKNREREQNERTIQKVQQTKPKDLAEMGIER